MTDKKEKEDKPLEWENLEESKCPKCGEKLELTEGVYDCSSFDCAFSIRESRALEILEEMEDGDNKYPYWGNPNDFYRND